MPFVPSAKERLGRSLTVVIKLAFVAVLAVALGVGATPGGAHLSAGTLQATLSAASESGECSPCEDCAKPCVASITCGTACISLGLTSDPQGISLKKFKSVLDDPIAKLICNVC
jgi:hypothetical protein